VLAIARAPLIDRDHELVRALADACGAVVGAEPAYGGGSWLADTASTGHLVPTVIFGPGHEPVYMPNEWLAVEDVHVAATVNAVTIAALLAPDA
jgi:acetylornithine deacetylase/succinyl-diaminopimelate desuccinylase-like protein